MTVAAPLARASLAQRWEELFTERASMRAVALLRIALGPITLLHLRPFLRDARAGIAYDDHFWEPFLPWLPHLPGGVWIALVWIGAAAAVLMTAGLATRLATTTAFAVVATNLLVSQTHFRHNRTFLAILLGGLALLQSGRVLSVDAWIRRRRGRPDPGDLVPVWPLWLLRVQVCGVYAASAVSKLVDPDWIGGLVLWDRVVRYQHVLDPTPLPAWAIDLLTSRWVYGLVGPLAVFTELFIAVGFWFPRTRLVAVWVALAFHAAIEVSAQVEVFSYAAIAALAIWVTPRTRDRVVAVPESPSGRAVRAAVRLGDWFGRFDVVPAPPGRRGIVVVDRDGRLRSGGDALRLVLSRLPLTFALAAPLHVPPLRGWLDRRAAALA